MFNREVVSYITLVHKFDGIRVTQGMLLPSKWTLRVNMSGLYITPNEEHEAYQKRISIVYQKIKMWLECFMNTIILTTAEEDPDMTLFLSQFGNPMVLLPYAPTDNIFTETLHSKMSVLGGKDMAIGEVVLSSEDTGTEYHFSNIMLGDASYSLPKQEEWLDSEHTVYSEPWWKRHDCDTCDILLEEGQSREELIENYGTAKLLDIMVNDIIDEYDEQFDDGAEPPSEEEPKPEADIIPLKTKWKPKVL